MKIHKLCARGAGSVLLAAATVSQGGEPDSLETVVVTGTYVPRALAELTSSVSVLDAQRLEQLNKRQLADALRTVPGVSIEQQGGSGGLSAVSIRGGEANFTQVLLDGIPLNDPTNSRGGSYDIGNINPASIERVEVVRGAQSAIYGSDALAGVVNLISRQPQDQRGASVRAELGESGYRNYGVAAGLSMDVATLSLDADSQQDDGLSRGSTRDVDSVNLRIAWHPVASHEVTAQVRYLDGERSSYPEQSGGPLYAASEELDTSEFTDLTAGLTWNAQLHKRWQSRLSTTFFEHDERYDSPGVAPYHAVPPNGSDTQFERTQASWLNTLELAQNYHLNLGIDHRRERGESTGYLDFGFVLPTDYTLSRDTTGLFADIQARPLPSLLLQASARQDNPEGFDDETTLRLGASYQLSPALRLQANWGEGFKLPSFFALGHALVGNPDLRPETGRGWDAGVQWALMPELRVSVNAFGNRYRDLVDFDPVAFTNVNRREVETRGGEWQFDWQPAQSLTVAAHATYTDIDVIGEDATLLGRPQWQAGAWFDWGFRQGWHTGLDYEWTGAVPASSLHTGATVITGLEAYHRLDWRLGWQALDTLDLELAVDNLLDEDYQTAVGFPAPGRTLRLAATLRLGGG